MQKSLLWKSLLLMGLIAVSLGVWTRFAPIRPAVASQADIEIKDDFNYKPFDVPEGDSDKLFEFAQELIEEDKDFSDPAEKREYQARSMLTLVAVADQILAQKKIDDDEAEKAAQLKTQGLINLAMLGAPKGAEKAVAVVREMGKDSRPILVQFSKNNEQLVRIILVGMLPEKDRDGLMEEVLAEVQKRKFAQRVLNRAQMLGESLEEAGDRDRVVEYYGKLATAMRESGIENLMGQAKRIEGQLHRIQLPGNFLAIEGTTLDGKKFNWDSYRGKVVLVDFWATWCGPCRQELPNVKRNYKKYHDQGFEVVGISLDEEPAKLKAFLKDQKIQWVTLFEPEPENRGWENPMAQEYGITGIPMAMLVDREGKVISTLARGPELSRLLAKLFDKDAE